MVGEGLLDRVNFVGSEVQCCVAHCVSHLPVPVRKPGRLVLDQRSLLKLDDLSDLDQGIYNVPTL